jgi:hypothetical protein
MIQANGNKSCFGSFSSLTRRAVSKIIVATIILAILAVSVAAFFVLIRNSGSGVVSSSQTSSISGSATSQTSSTVTNTSETTTNSSTIQTSSESTTSVTTSSQIYTNITLSAFDTFTNLFGNFSSLKLQFNETCAGQCSQAGPYNLNETTSLSYAFNGTESVNSTEYQVYNFEVSAGTQGSISEHTLNFEFLSVPSNETSFIIVNGTTTKASSGFFGEGSITGFLLNTAISYGEGYSWRILNQSQTALSGLPLSAITYFGNESGSGANYTITVVEGSLVGTNTFFPISVLATTSFSQGYLLVLSWQVISITKA